MQVIIYVISLKKLNYKIISASQITFLFVVQFLYPPIDLFPINEKLRFHCS